MNHHTHRLIFSRARGCMMAVAETAKSSSKAGGESRPRTTSKSKHCHARKPYADCLAGRLWLQVNTGKACRPSCFLKPSKNSLQSASKHAFGGTFLIEGLAGSALEKLGSDPHLPSCATLASVMQGQTPLGSSGSSSTNTVLDRVAGLYLTNPNGTLSMSANNTIAFIAANIQSAGNLQASANDITLGTVSTGSQQRVSLGNGNFIDQGGTQDVGTSLGAGKTIQLQARNNITATAATIEAVGNVNLIANNSVNLLAGCATSNYNSAISTTNNGLLSSSTKSIAASQNASQSIGTQISGANVSINAGNITAVGATIVADNNVNLVAAGDINITTATNTYSSSRTTSQSDSGLMTNSPTSVSYGSRNQSTTQTSSGTTVTGSTIGALNGSINIQAGGNYTQTGSSLITGTLNQTTGQIQGGGDVNIKATNVTIQEARESSTSTTSTSFSQSGVTVSVGAGIIGAAQTVQQTNKAAGQTSSGRMKDLAAVSNALAIANAMSSPAPSATASVGSASSSSTSTSTTSTGVGSTIRGSNVNIQATGAGLNSTLTIQGSNVQGANNTSLVSDGNINLLASQNTQTETSSSSSSSASVGGSSSGGVTVSGSGGRGSGSGQGTSYTNTNVNAGNTLTIQSGGDTNLIGATASGNRTNVQVAGNLTIQSLQDTSSYTEQSSSSGASVTFTGFVPTGGSVSVGRTNINSNYQSVNQTSGIRAGDGGFNVSVGGNTKLIGGQITSTANATTGGANGTSLNSFKTNGTLTVVDLNNSASYSASGYSVTIGTGGSAGVGKDSGSASSTTQSGITGIAGNTSLVTGGAGTNTSIAPIFNATTVRNNVNAQVQITQTFGRQAANAVGNLGALMMQPVVDAKTYQDLDSRRGNLSPAEQQQLAALEKSGMTPAKAQAALDDPNNQANYANWSEGGVARVAAHALMGGLSGGLSGALGAGSVAAAAPLLDDLQNQIQAGLTSTGVSPATANAIAKALTQTVALGVGTITGGAAGGAAGLNTDANNRQLHDIELKKLAQLKQGKTAQEQQRLEDAACALVHCAEGRPDSDPEKAALLDSEKRGQGYTSELALLGGTGLFTYTSFDKTLDALNAKSNLNVGGKRAEGVVNLVNVNLAADLCGADAACLQKAVLTLQMLADDLKTQGASADNVDRLALNAKIAQLQLQLGGGASNALGAALIGAAVNNAGNAGANGVNVKGSPKLPPNLEPVTNPPQGPVIPPNWESRPGTTPGSVIYYPPGTDPSAAGSTYIRVMPPGSSPNPGQENGYWQSVFNGQPINPATGGTGSRGQTHIPLPPDSMPPTRP